MVDVTSVSMKKLRWLILKTTVKLTCELLFQCRHESKFKLLWLEATKASTLDNSRDLDAGGFYLK